MSRTTVNTRLFPARAGSTAGCRCRTTYDVSNTPACTVGGRRTTDRRLFSSESDYPFDFVPYPGTAAQPITPARVLTLLGLPGDTLAEVRTVDDFFSRWATDDLSADPSDRTVASHYRALRRALETSLTDLQVIRVGRNEIKVLIIGHDACGNVVGVSTTSIET